ncbi:MAG: 50S ribosomal protein L7/L12 [Nitrospinota bacterium]|jgi:large subunit ribosomal protein L7/L12|nr:50S ribosomal protein L7/L12 [Nitrospinota bacterium]MDP6279880.1 50S ribosomal protein L7/L12 [Nitrospinota bacterium]MDP6366982.1 50S ribosomal protein L7/L12 [Nitrospinota bacterium]MDP7167295.1 50S ribosomal protein L7/L12 [Nitrospinota bacterium]MDP7371757.1 50S ribosomal protein L7/L12 [Nitrospinota bacterium]
MVATKEDVISFIESMTVLELSEFVKELEEKFGVSAAAPVMMGGAMPAGGEAAEAEEKTEFTVTLKVVGQQKIKVIKAIRELTSLGLKEAKEVADTAPKAVVENVSKEDADAAADKLKEVGAEVEIS